MKKTILIVALVLVVLIGGAFVFVGTAINKDVVKNKIVQFINDKTKIKLEIKEPIKLSFFPWIGVVVKDVTLSNIPNLDKKSFVKLGAINVSVKLLPLMSGKVDSDQLAFNDCNLQLNQQYKFDGLNLSLKNIYFQNKDIPKSSSVYDFLRVAKFNGLLEIDTAKIDKLEFKNFFTKINNNNGLINSSKIGFNFYGGFASGDADLDVRKNIPKLTIKFGVTDVQMRSLLLAVANNGKFSGDFSLDINGTISNLADKNVIKSFNASGNVLIANGSYQGIDIPYEVRRAGAIINQKPLPQESQPSRTGFDKMTASFKINNGLLSTNDILIQAPDYKVTGQGNIDLVFQRVNLRLNAAASNDEKFFLPIKVSGTFSDISVRPDMSVITKHVIDEVKEKVKEQIGKQLEKINVPKEIGDLLHLPGI